jgi:hypothetical protein
MKPPISGLLFVLLAAAGACFVAAKIPAKLHAAEAVAGEPLMQTNTVITCVQGAELKLPTNAVFRGSVRIFDPQLYLECERLSVFFPSNSPAASQTMRAGGSPNLGSLSRIIATSNLLMILRGATLIGDYALYDATNDLIHVTGEVVIIETESGYAYGTNFMFNRQTMELHSIGPSTLESKPGVSLTDGSNSLFDPAGRSRRNPAPASNPPPTTPRPRPNP